MGTREGFSVGAGVRAKTNKGNTNTILSNPQLTDGREGEEGAVSGELKIFGQKTAMGQWSDTNCVFCFVSSP